MIAVRFGLILVGALALTTTASANVSKESCMAAHGRGQDAREQGKLTLARKLFLTCAQAACPNLLQDECASEVDALTRMLPTLSFAARDASGADLPDTTVYVDDVLTATRLDDGKAFEVDPGKHVIKFSNASEEQTVTVVVGTGEKSRPVVVRFARTERAPLLPTTTAASARTSSGATRPGGAKAVMIAGGIIALGGGALAVVGFLRIPSNCSFSTRQCLAPPDDPALVDASSAVQLSNIGLVVAGIGATAIAGGLLWYLTGEKKSPREGNLVAPYITPDSAGVAAIGRF